MGFDQKGSVVIRVSRGDQGRWDVSEDDFDDPLASFDDKQSACDYANKLTMAKEGAAVVVFDDSTPDSSGKNLNQGANKGMDSDRGEGETRH